MVQADVVAWFEDGVNLFFITQQVRRSVDDVAIIFPFAAAAVTFQRMYLSHFLARERPSSSPLAKRSDPEVWDVHVWWVGVVDALPTTPSPKPYPT